ncbi:site-specific integrase [Arenimonas alkanexedens]
MDDDIFKKGLKHLQQGTAKEWVSGKVSFPNGLTLEDVQITDDADERRFNQFVASQLAGSATAPTLVASPTPPPSPATMLASRAEAYLVGFGQSGRSVGNNLDTEHTLDLFVGLMSDRPMASFTSDDVRRFLGYMECWPKHATKRQGLNRKRDKTPAERDLERAAKRTLAPDILKTAPSKPTKDTLSIRAVDKHRDNLRKFFVWAVKERLIQTSPMEAIKGLTKQVSDAPSKMDFTDEDLAVIFQPARFAKHMATDPSRFWGMALCLYTGARVGEIAQLQVDEVEQVSGVWEIHFRPWRKDQSHKNPQGLRFLPLHSALVEAGFVDYVKDIRALNQQHASQEANIKRRRSKQPAVLPIERLMPNLPYSKRGGYGDGLSDRINGYLRNHCQITDTQKTCHSFRHTFSTRLDKASTETLRIASLTGHKRSDILSRVYIQPTTLADRASAIERLDMPGITLAKYTPGQFNALLLKLLNPASPSP